MTDPFYVLLYRTVFTVALISPFIKAFLITMLKLPLGSSDLSATFSRHHFLVIMLIELRRFQCSQSEGIQKSTHDFYRDLE